MTAAVSNINPDFASGAFGQLRAGDGSNANSMFSKLKVVYQPIVRLGAARGETIAYEALLRVPGPGGTMVSPVDFIRQAEHDGTISHVDRWVMCSAAKRLSENPDLRIWLNTSRVSLSDRAFVEDAMMILDFTKTHDRFTLEVTESAEGCPTSLQRNIDMLYALGLTMIIDDLWDGFSADDLVASPSVNGCKLSGTTMAKLLQCSRTQKRTKQLLQACGEAKKIVVLEGVETEEHLEMAERLGFEYCQGWYFGSPVTF